MEPTFTTRPELVGSFGMVASTHWLASAVGMAVLEKGGNAFDAAVAGGFVLEVVEPHLNGPAGDAPILAWDAGQGRAVTVCGQGPAPAGASIPVFRGLGLDLVPGTGLLAACVPGAVGAWLRLLADHGTLPLREVLGYAIGYAHDGFPVVHQISETIGRVATLFREHWPTSAATWLVDGAAPVPGSTLRNPVLGATFERLLAEAEAASTDRLEQIEAAHRVFYAGFVAEAIAEFCAGQEVLDSSGRRHRGLLSGDDLARWRPPVEDPVALDYAGYTVLKAGPWSQGPVLLQQLALLRGLDLADVGPLSAEFVHVVTETAKLAYADREAFYGDPLFAEVPLAELLAPGYNASAGGCWASRPTWVRCGPVPRAVAVPGSPTSPGPGGRPGERSPAPGSRPSGPRTPRRVATRATSTSSTAGATWCRRRPVAAGCRAPRSSRRSGSRSARGPRCSSSTRGCRTPSPRASGRAPRSPRRWRCGTGGPPSPSAPPAVTGRTSGSCSSSSGTCTTG